MKFRLARAPYARTVGFTLIELLIVVTIVAILAAIAVPSYQNYIVRGNRAAARACMSEYAQFMERFYTTNMTYVGGAPGSALGCASEGSLDQKYTISASATAPTQRTYTITATPINAQLSRDTACGTLTVNQLGARSQSGTSNEAYCWNR